MRKGYIKIKKSRALIKQSPAFLCTDKFAKFAKL